MSGHGHDEADDTVIVPRHESSSAGAGGTESSDTARAQGRDERGRDDDDTVLVRTGPPVTDPSPQAPAAREPSPTNIVDDDPTQIAEDDPTVIVPQHDGELEAHRPTVREEWDVRRIVRPGRVVREPLQPRPVPEGRFGPPLPGAGPGTVSATPIRSVRSDAAPAPGPRTTAVRRRTVPSVVQASRRRAVVVAVAVLVAVVVSVAGLIWVGWMLLS